MPILHQCFGKLVKFCRWWVTEHWILSQEKQRTRAKATQGEYSWILLYLITHQVQVVLPQLFLESVCFFPSLLLPSPFPLGYQSTKLLFKVSSSLLPNSFVTLQQLSFLQISRHPPLLLRQSLNISKWLHSHTQHALFPYSITLDAPNTLDFFTFFEWMHYAKVGKKLKA